MKTCSSSNSKDNKVCNSCNLKPIWIGAWDYNEPFSPGLSTIKLRETKL